MCPTDRRSRQTEKVDADINQFAGSQTADHLTGFLSRGRAGEFADAIALAELTGHPADINAVRRCQPGVSLHIEQQVTGTLLFNFIEAGSGLVALSLLASPPILGIVAPHCPRRKRSYRRWRTCACECRWDRASP